MPLFYIPLSISKCCKELNIPISNYVNNFIYNKFSEFYEESFCTFELTKGKNKNNICGARIKDSYKFCKRHMKIQQKIEDNSDKNVIIKKNKIHCKASSLRRKQCGRIVLNDGDLCSYHNKNITNIDRLNDIKRKKIFNKFKFVSLYLMYNKKKKEKEKSINISDIKTMKCEDILELININYKKESHNQYRIKDDKYNIVIRGDKYYDNFNTSTGIGVGVINFYMYIMNKDFKTAINDLSTFFISFSSCNKYKNKIKLLNNSNRINKIKSLLNNKMPEEKKENIIFVKKYLKENRFINSSIIDKLIDDGNISADVYKNCIFYNNDRTYAFVRGTNSDFKQNVGSPSFIIYKTKNNPLYLFESVIDLISYIDIKNLKDGMFVSTSGNMMIGKIKQLLTNETREIIYCFDNDRQGKNNVKKIKDELKYENLIHVEDLPNKKDWNSELKFFKNKK